MCRLYVLNICRIFVYKSIHSSSSYFLSFWSVPSNFPTSQTSRPRTPKWMPSNLRWFLKEVQLDFLHKVSFKLAFTFLSFTRVSRGNSVDHVIFVIDSWNDLNLDFFLLLGFVWLCLGTMNLILKPCKSTRICNWSKIGRAGDLAEKSEN